MKKRIVAIVLCAVMLLSFTSCGIRIGDIDAEDVINNIVNELGVTTVVESENHKINIGMMAYYYQCIGGYLSRYDLVPDFAYHYEYIMDVSEHENDYKDGVSHELIMSETIYYARDVLMYCELALANGIALDAEDQRNVESQYIDYVEMEMNVPRSDTEDDLADKILEFVANNLFDVNDIRLAIEYSVLAEKGKEEMIRQIEASVSNDEIEDRHGRLDRHEEFYHSEVAKNYCVLEVNDPSEAERAIGVLEKADVSCIDDVIRVAEENELGSVSVKRNSYPNVEPTHDVERWLYSPERENGDIMSIPDSNLVVFYECDGEEIWRVYVRYLIASERIGKAKLEFSERYPNSLNHQALDLFEAIMDA